mgnify:CR=1 FL=1
MSYCVNCGVELDDSAKKCALCGAPVLNPYLDEPEEALPPPYPDRLALPEGTNRRYIAFLVSMVLLIPNLICGVANLLILDSGVWSAYIVSSSLCFGCFHCSILMEKPRPLVLWLLDTLAGTLYTWLYYVVGWGPRGWFCIGLPLILGLSVISLFMISWLGRKRRDWPHVSIAVLAEITLYAVYADVLFSLYQHTGRPLQYSLVIAVCCLALMAVFYRRSAQ